MIIGVALVVDDLSKGEKMVFRYPESVPSALFDLSNEALVKFHRDYISFSPDNFAKLFRPKAALANTILDVIIDDLHYISFPCTCAFNASSDINKDSKAESGISLFNVVVTKVRDEAMRRFQNMNAYGVYHKEAFQESENFAKEHQLLDPGSDPISVALGLRGNFRKEVSLESIKNAVEAFSRGLLLLENNQKYVSQQVALIFDILEGSHLGYNDPDSSLDNLMRSKQPRQSVAVNMSSDTGENQKSEDKVVVVVDINPVSAVDMLNQSWVGNKEYGDEDLEDVEVLLQYSTLANELRRLYHGLIGGHSVVMSLGDTVNMNVRLESHSHLSKDKDRRKKGEGRGDEEKIVVDGNAPMEGGPEGKEEEEKLLEEDYEFTGMTLLCMGEPHELSIFINENENTGVSNLNPHLSALVAAADPTRSMSEVALSLEMTVGEVYTMGRHLCTWGLASIIPVITSSSVLEAHPGAILDTDSDVAKAFFYTFLDNSLGEMQWPAGLTVFEAGATKYSIPCAPRYNLGCVLAIFDGERTLERAAQLLLEPLQGYVVDMTVWLIRRRMLIVKDPRENRQRKQLAKKLKAMYPFEVSE